MDHGTLNIPLAKRGNIDAQLDRYKADQKRAEKERQREREAERKALKPLALSLLESASPGRIAALAAKCGMTPAAVRKELKSKCHWQPQFIVRFFS